MALSDDLARAGGDDVLAVARVAARVIGPHRELRRSLYPSLAALHRTRRREYVLQQQHPDAVGTSPRRFAFPSRAVVWKSLWGTALGLGILAAIVAAAVVGPSRYERAGLDGDVSAVVVVIAAPVAVLLLAALLFVRVPAGQAAHIGFVFSAVTAAIGGLALVYRLFAGAGVRRDFTPDQLAVVLVALLIVELVVIALAVRLWPAVRRQQRDDHRRRPPERMTRGERRELDRLVATWARMRPEGPAADELSAAWSRELSRLEGRGVDAATLSAARSTTPVAWLVAVFDDGSRDPAALTEVLRAGAG